MGLLEKAGNIQTNEKEPAKDKKVAEAEVKAFDAAVAQAAVVAKPSKKAKKAKKVKAAKAPKAAKKPRVRKERVLKEFPEGFDEVNKARSWFRSLVDLGVNFSMFTFYLATNIVAGGASDLTYVPVSYTHLTLPTTPYV